MIISEAIRSIKCYLGLHEWLEMYPRKGESFVKREITGRRRCKQCNRVEQRKRFGKYEYFGGYNE